MYDDDVMDEYESFRCGVVVKGWGGKGVKGKCFVEVIFLKSVYKKVKSVSDVEFNDGDIGKKGFGRVVGKFVGRGKFGENGIGCCSKYYNFWVFEEVEVFVCGVV